MRYVFADSDRPAPLQEADLVAQESSPPQPLPLPTAPVMVQQEGSPLRSAPLSVAPMMAWTDHHFRQLLRLLTRRTLLYTEMYPVDVVLEAAAAPRDGPMRHETAAPRGKATGEWKPTSLAERTHTALRQLLAFDPTQHPIAVQLGGRHPDRMGEAARLCASFGYDEVNINVGCPSDTVCGNGYGACLMREAGLVQQLAAAVRANVPDHVAVSVKHRLGVDECDSWEELVAFVEAVSAPPARVTRFVVHARTAILGLSTADNRAVPPLRHEMVFRLAERFPHLEFELNGQVGTLAQAEQCLKECGGVLRGCMVGRAAFYSPWRLADADRRLCGAAANPNLSRREVVARYAAYAETVWAEAMPLLEGEVREAMYALPGGRAGRVTDQGVQKRLKPRLKVLRDALYQPLQHLFSDDGAAGAEYEKRLLQAWERKMPLAKGCQHAMRAVPDAIADAVAVAGCAEGETAPGA